MTIETRERVAKLGKLLRENRCRALTADQADANVLNLLGSANHCEARRLHVVSTTADRCPELALRPCYEGCRTGSLAKGPLQLFGGVGFGAHARVEMVYSSKDYGNVIVLSFIHEAQHRFAAYAHLSKVQVSAGQFVQRGQQIGLTGDTGNAKGMPAPDQHLHFEIRTVARPGTGLAGRVSPLEVFRQIPLDKALEN